ncbi:hypothetical protein L0244_24085, partial [bacterium]|nr:hypothetical protein [bacterium]
MQEVRNDQQTLIERTRAARQAHVLIYWNKLSDDSQHQLLHQLSLIDFGLMERLYRESIVHKKKPDISALAPAEIITLAHQREHPEEIAKMIAHGEEELRAGKIAAVLVAGGQASR